MDIPLKSEKKQGTEVCVPCMKGNVYTSIWLYAQKTAPERPQKLVNFLTGEEEEKIKRWDRKKT